MTILGIASVQYGDMKGTVAADDADRNGFAAFAKANGVDTDKFFPVAVSSYSGDGDFESITILAIEKTTAGTYEEIQEYARNHDGRIPTKKFDTDAKIADLLRHFKRFEAILRSRSVDGIEIEYEGGPI